MEKEISYFPVTENYSSPPTHNKMFEKGFLIICPILKHNNEEIQTCAADIVLMTVILQLCKDLVVLPVGC